MSFKILEDIASIGIVPLVVLDDASQAAPLAHALCDGGIPVAEVTFRTDAAAKAIGIMSDECPDMLVGSGTVHNVDQAWATLDNGGRFVITPGFNPKVVNWCLKHNLAVCPGTVTPSDLEMALDFGLDVVKFFPAAAYGGVKTLKALAGPYASLKFVPTGGVNLENLSEYLSLKNVAAVGGSCVPDPNQGKAEYYASIRASCKEILEKVKAIRA